MCSLSFFGVLGCDLIISPVLRIKFFSLGLTPRFLKHSFSESSSVWVFLGCMTPQVSIPDIVPSLQMALRHTG